MDIWTTTHTGESLYETYQQQEYLNAPCMVLSHVQDEAADDVLTATYGELPESETPDTIISEPQHDGCVEDEPEHDPLSDDTLDGLYNGVNDADDYEHQSYLDACFFTLNPTNSDA